MSDSNSQTQPKINVILASGSPRRLELLQNAGVSFTVRVPEAKVDETLAPDEASVPEEAAKKLAERKAGAVMQELLAARPVGMYAVIGADTMVVKDGEVFGKPANLDDAKRMLRKLSGGAHQVITAVSVWLLAAPDADDISMAYRTFADTSTVVFKPLTDEQIADYLKKGESFDKAGAYAIQGEGRQLIEKYDGDFDTIVGLPVRKLLSEFPDLVN